MPLNQKKYPLLADLLQQAAPTQAAPANPAGTPSLKKKEAVKQFNKPDMDEAKLTIRTGRAFGFDGYDVILTLPVSADFLKEKNKDPFGEIAYMASQWMAERTGMNLGRPSISTIDVQRARAKGGMKDVPLIWMVSDPIYAYALGADLSVYSFYGDVPARAEIDERKALAKKTASEALALRKAIRANEKPESEWKSFIDGIQPLGMNYKIAKLYSLESALSPTKPSQSRSFTLFQVEKPTQAKEAYIAQFSNPDNTYDIYEIWYETGKEFADMKELALQSASPYVPQGEDIQLIEDYEFEDRVLSLELIRLIFELADPSGDTDLEISGPPAGEGLLSALGKLLTDTNFKD